MSQSQAVLMQSTRNSAKASDEWKTPVCVLDPIRALDPRGQIGLDPAGHPQAVVRARMEWYGLARASVFQDGEGTWNDGVCVDGLVPPWTGHGLVFCNPPYGRNLYQWTRKAAIEGKRMEGDDQLVLLVPARTDTEWWVNHVAARAQAVGFWRGRITFLGAASGATFPSALVYYGDHAGRFAKALDAECWTVVP